MGARWGGWLVLALLMLGWAVAAAPARADEPAKELTDEERGALEKRAKELNQQSFPLYQDGKYAAATKVLEKSLEISRRVYPVDKYPDGHPNLASSLNNLGFLLQERGEYGRAEPLYREALEMRRRLYPEEKYPGGHPDLADSLNNLGFLLQNRGEYGKAEPLYREALKMRRRLYPAEKYPGGHDDLAANLHNLGSLLRARGDYGKAEPFYRDALEMDKNLYPADKYPDGHPELAESLNGLGILLEAQGEYSKAEPFYRDALEMRRRLYPAEKYPDGHPDLAGGLINLGDLLRLRGEYGKAEPLLRDALEMCRHLYPAEKYPDGHPYLAKSLCNVGGLLFDRGEYSRAEPLLRDAVEMYKKLFPADKYPDGHPELAMSLDNMGAVLNRRGEYAKAEPFYRDALGMRNRLYPAEKYPRGHPDRVQSLINLGLLLESRGEYGKAEPLFRDALEMNRNLYPADKYPGGHPKLALSLDNMGGLLKARGEYGKADSLWREALEMRRRLYPVEKYPDGHPDLADSLNDLGLLLEARGEYDKAEPYFRDVLEMDRKLYPAETYPDGHPDLAESLHNLGSLLVDRDDYSGAEPLFRDALEMHKKLYPAEKYPDGHPALAWSLNNLGYLLKARGKYDKAADIFAEGTTMHDRLVATFADGGAEAETLNLAASLPGSRIAFLAATAHVKGAKPAEHYLVLWQSKSALARGLQRRRRLLHAAAEADEATRRKVQTLIGVRQDVARLVLAPARPGDADRAQLVQDLTDKKERLEKELAALLPASGRGTLSYPDLADRLPERTAFIDLYRYRALDPQTRKWDDGHYAAFLLRKGRPIRRVELVDAAAIDKDLVEWRGDIVKDLRSDAAARLRKAVWEPIAVALGEGVDTVYVCPDGPLSALPWSALPGERPGSVLLEDYAFAVTPGGPSLLEQLTDPAPARRGPGVLLAVGGVRYDRAGAPTDKAGKPWKGLPATDKEREAVISQARKLPKPPEVVERSGADANTAQLVKDLPDARWAHLATHGFFAAPESTEREHLVRPDDFLIGVRGERRGAAARNPLTLSGLVLAGANQPTDADSGVLSAETVAGLNLDDMDLAVLSACQTGLGEAATGEGVFGLQRAFHIAGAKNVVASLWTVDDDATAALMNLFYHHLWEKGETPLEALHHAQLELYRNPSSIPTLARGVRAGDFSETVQVVTKPPADPKAPPKRAAAVKDWAAFVLSGAGR